MYNLLIQKNINYIPYSLQYNIIVFLRKHNFPKKHNLEHINKHIRYTY